MGGGGFDALASAGIQNRIQNQRDEREAKLHTILQAGLPPEQQRDAIQTLYQNDPSALKQHVINLVGRLTGKQPQPTPWAYPPQPDARWAAAAQGSAPTAGAPSQTSGQPSPFMAAPNPKGLVEPGNLPIWNRPTIQNADGSHSSEYSTSFQDDQGREVLVPTIVNGRFLTPDGKKPPEGSPQEKAMFQAAWQNYLKTGQHLGKFDNPDNADAYAGILHNRGQGGAPAPRSVQPAGYPGAKTQADRLTQDLAGGTTPDQRALAFQKAREDDIAARTQQERMQRLQETEDLINKHVPEGERKKVLQQWAQRQAGIPLGLKSIPAGAGGAAYQNADGEWVTAMRQADGSTVEVPLPPDWKPPAPKSGAAGWTNGTSREAGGNVRVKPNPNGPGVIDINTGKVLTDFKPFQTFAQTGSFSPVETIGDDGSVGMGTFNRKTGKITTPTGGTAALPPGVAKDLNTNLQAANEANTRLRTMTKNAKDALNGDQQAMLSLVANHIGMTLGAQKGARINQTVWNEAVEATPWLAGIEAHWDPDTGYLKKIALTPQQIGQMVSLAQQRQQDIWQQARQAGQLYGVDVNPRGLDAPGGEGSKGPGPKKGPKPIVQHSKSTDQYRYSMDGGKTWLPGQPPK